MKMTTYKRRQLKRALEQLKVKREKERYSLVYGWILRGMIIGFGLYCASLVLFK